MKKLIVLILALCLLLPGCGQQPAETTATTAAVEVPQPVEAKWDYGSINTKTGADRAVEQGTSLRTRNYLPIRAYSDILPKAGYSLNWFVYDAEETFLGSGASFSGNGVGVSVEKMLKANPDGVYFRLVLQSAYENDSIVLDEKVPILFYTADEPWEAPMTTKMVAAIGSKQSGGIQDGEAFGDRLFVFDAVGTMNVYDVNTGEHLDACSLGNKDLLTPHVNSASFSNQYYAEGDTYPLIYTSMYNNLTPSNQYLLGTCCVYRITESAGQFSAQLVQVIRIGFIGDANLWTPYNDSRPFGNFVVDTDRNMFYALVPRDKTSTTRFLGFSLPKPDAGTYKEEYGCNQVILQATDIKRQFDVSYISSPQGCTYHDGKIYSVEGFGSFESAPPFLRVINVETGMIVRSVNLGQMGLIKEPEVITVANEQLYYLAIDGMLYKLSFAE